MLTNKQFKSIIMSKFFKPKSILGLFLIAILAFSCSSDDNTDISIPPPGDDDPVATFDAELSVFEAGGDMREVTVSADGSTGMEITSKVSFQSETNMRRLYITEQINGGTPEPFQFTSQEVDEKPDGSLDLVGDDKKEFEFQINLPAPMAEGESIVYTFWATTGRGDFRDVTKRNAIDDTALGTITLNFGTPTMGNEGEIVEYSIELKAPLGDGSSQTFTSVYNGNLYRISEGEETAALWDFGYYYFGTTDLASLGSTANYPALFNFDTMTNTGENVSQLTGVPQEELNSFFIAPSTLDYDTVTDVEIDAIVTPTSERATGLAVGDVLEFEDAYGNKGVIKVETLTAGAGTNGVIGLAIKVKS